MLRRTKQNIYPFLLLSLVSMLLLGLLIIPIITSAAEISEDMIVASVCDTAISIEEMEEYFMANGLEHYAYMDIKDAPDELIPVILEARTRIIYGDGAAWVADDVDGCIKDQDGNIIEILPHFHEVFPEDWELPVRKCS